MPALKQMKTVEVVQGMICDVCGLRDDLGYNTFCVDHTFGYGSKLDMHSVGFSVCDQCLATIIVDRIPHAIFRTSDGNSIPTDDIKSIINDGD